MQSFQHYMHSILQWCLNNLGYPSQLSYNVHRACQTFWLFHWIPVPPSLRENAHWNGFKTRCKAFFCFFRLVFGLLTYFCCSFLHLSPLPDHFWTQHIRALPLAYFSLIYHTSQTHGNNKGQLSNYRFTLELFLFLGLFQGWLPLDSDHEEGEHLPVVAFGAPITNLVHI